jgi:hypothetical protein
VSRTSHADSRPGYVPEGFAFARQLGGSAAGGFGDETDQVLSVYTRGASIEDLLYPLMVFAGPASGRTVLAATEQRNGQTINLNVDGTTAEYHDGMWILGGGVDERKAGPVTLHWDRGSAHSLTVTSPNWVFGIRAPVAGFPLDELVRIAQSLPLN